MKKPILNNLWEMGIKIEDTERNYFFTFMKIKIIPVINLLKNRYSVEWYTYDIHNNRNGAKINWDGPQVHIRFENSRNVSKSELMEILPDYCEGIEKIDPVPSDIDGLNVSMFKNDDYSEVWKLDGELAEWIINMILAYKEEIPISHIYQFYHFIENRLLAPGIWLPTDRSEQVGEHK